MAKAKTPSFILELELSVNSHEKAVLRKKLNIGRQIYNACLGESLKRLHKVQADKEYQFLLTQKSSSERNARIKAICLSHGYTEYQLHAWASQCGAHFFGQVGSNEVQKLATRAFNAVEKIRFRKAKKVYFKGKDDLISVENKSNKSGLRWSNGKIIW